MAGRHLSLDGAVRVYRLPVAGVPLADWPHHFHNQSYNKLIAVLKLQISALHIAQRTPLCSHRGALCTHRVQISVPGVLLW